MEKQKLEWWSLPRLKQALRKNDGSFRYGFNLVMNIVLKNIEQQNQRDHNLIINVQSHIQTNILEGALKDHSTV